MKPDKSHGDDWPRSTRTVFAGQISPRGKGRATLLPWCCGGIAYACFPYGELQRSGEIEISGVRFAYTQSLANQIDDVVNMTSSRSDQYYPDNTTTPRQAWVAHEANRRQSSEGLSSLSQRCKLLLTDRFRRAGRDGRRYNNAGVAEELHEISLVSKDGVRRLPRPAVTTSRRSRHRFFAVT